MESASHETWKFPTTLSCPSKQSINALRFSIGKWIIISSHLLFEPYLVDVEYRVAFCLD